jgi:hypothetical protein
MAEKDTRTPEQKVIDRALKNLKKAVDAVNHNYQAGVDDLRFANGEQWEQTEKQRRARSGRPALTVNLLPEYIDQVTGDMRHNCPQIKFRAVDTKADVHMAKIREALVNQIQYSSNARDIYINGGEMAVKCGYGAWRVLTRYCDDNPFLQEIYLEAVNNPFLVYFDPRAKDVNYADAKYAFIMERMARSEFEDRYPDAEVPGENFKVNTGLGQELWYDKDHVTVAEYFERSSETVTMCQLDDGSYMTEEEYKERVKSWEADTEEAIKAVVSQPVPTQPPSPPVRTNPNNPAPPQAGTPEAMAPQPITPVGRAGQAPPPQPPAPNQQGAALLSAPAVNPMQQITPKPKVVKKRELERPVIKHYVLTCLEILNKKKERKNESNEKVVERTADTIAGEFIPLVLVRGKITNIEGKEIVQSLIRNAKDSQKLLNYWTTTAAETVALAPKSPWIGTAKHFEGYEADYANANTENIPYLKYNVDPEAPSGPQKVPVAQPPQAVFQQIAVARENLKAAIGMFNADLGDAGPERTGAAINARQRPGDIGTYVFMDHLTSAIAHTGRIINSMIPFIYDTERDIRLRGVDDSESFVPVNTTVKEALRLVKQHPERYSKLDITRLQRAAAKYGVNAKFNDMTAGKYDVYATVGPSYATQRAESADMLFKMFNSMPQQMGMAADLIVENLDFKDADRLARRLRKSLPPHLLEQREGEELGQAPPNPAMVAIQAKMQTEQSKVLMAQMKLQMEQIKTERERMKLQMEVAKIQMEIQKAQQAGDSGSHDKHMQRLMDAMELDRKHELEQQRLILEEAKLQHQITNDNKPYADN